MSNPTPSAPAVSSKPVATPVSKSFHATQHVPTPVTIEVVSTPPSTHPRRFGEYVTATGTVNGKSVKTNVPNGRLLGLSPADAQKIIAKALVAAAVVHVPVAPKPMPDLTKLSGTVSV